MAIKFGNEVNAKKFFEAFEDMKNYVLKMEAKKIKAAESCEVTQSNVSPAAAEGASSDEVTETQTKSASGVTEKLSEMTVNTS